MVATVILGITALLGVLGLVAISSIIVKPLSLLLAGFATVRLLVFLEDNLEYGFGELEDRLVNLGLSILAGYVVFKIIGWLIVLVGIIAALVLGAALVLVGPGGIYDLLSEVLQDV